VCALLRLPKRCCWKIFAPADAALIEDLYGGAEFGRGTSQQAPLGGQDENMLGAGGGGHENSFGGMLSLAHKVSDRLCFSLDQLDFCENLFWASCRHRPMFACVC
jgi:hypothetical protein